MKRLKTKYFGVALCIGLASFGVASSILIAQNQQSEQQQAEKVVRQFWTAMGETDSDGLKSTLAWPSILQEVTPSSVGASFTYRSAADFDEDTKGFQPRADEEAEPNGFANVVILDVKIDILNNSMASVTYKCRFPRIEVPEPKTLSMLTVLQKQPLQNWKISYTTIPQ